MSRSGSNSHSPRDRSGPNRIRDIVRVRFQQNAIWCRSRSTLSGGIGSTAPGSASHIGFSSHLNRLVNSFAPIGLRPMRTSSRCFFLHDQFERKVSRSRPIRRSPVRGSRNYPRFHPGIGSPRGSRESNRDAKGSQLQAMQSDPTTRARQSDARPRPTGCDRRSRHHSASERTQKSRSHFGRI